MKSSKRVSLPADPKKKRSYLCAIFPAASLICLVFFIGSIFVATDYTEAVTHRFARWHTDEDVPIVETVTCKNQSTIVETDTCKNQAKPEGSETLPMGIISKTTNLDSQPLAGPTNKRDPKHSMNLLAIPVGIKQKENVNKMVRKFPSNDFVVMLFHYDGMVNEWNDQEWSHRALHVSVINQTKWWFAKRFLHPDIVAEYDYIFLWDEDLGVEHFNPTRYLSIVKEEGLEISQPALDAARSFMHHPITALVNGSKVHRRTSTASSPRCDVNSTGPPCSGWVEMMAPVFSRASWKCTWYMIQNDLIHAWGLDFQLGYCAQGDRTKKVGVVDAEFLIHQGIPTLGGLEGNTKTTETSVPASQAASQSNENKRSAVRKRSLDELEMFKRRWTKSVRDDKCWIDPFHIHTKQ